MFCFFFYFGARDSGMFLILGLGILGFFLIYFGARDSGVFCIWGSGLFGFGVGDLWGSPRVWPR